MAATACPQCGAVVAEGDRFCEACGWSLAEEAGVVTSAQTGAETAQPTDDHPANCATDAGPSPTATGPTPAAGQPCVGCGAPPDAIGPDGYCTICGRRQPAPRDHLEIDLGWAAGVTDKGRRHPRNEDALFLQTIGNAAVAVVCDGVSTTAHPDQASQVAAGTAGTLLAGALQEQSDRPDRPDIGTATTDAAQAAQTAVVQLHHTGDDPNTAPATTFVAATFHRGAVTVGSIGDSRAYWLSATDAQQLTVDDSWAEQQVEAGALTTKAAEADPRAHGITRWLGAGAPEGGPRLHTFEPPGPGRLLLCSDGLWNYIDTSDELRALVQGQPPTAAPLDLARNLTNYALNAGGHDNITVVIIDLNGAPTEGAP